jgi:CBS domain-containing protein
MAKSVAEAMTPYPACATPEMPVAEAAAVMSSKDVGSLPVVSGNHLVGMITDRDIVRRVVAQDREAAGMTVGEVASSDPVTVDSSEDLDRAMQLMAERQVRRLPVVDDGVLVGILSQADVAATAKERQAGEMLEEISRSVPSDGAGR